MSVSASVVQKIMRGSAWARNITSVFAALTIVAVMFTGITVAMGGIAGQKVLVGPYVFSPGALGPWTNRLFVMLVVLIGGALVTASMLLIRSVFADLARGNIFCDANVRRIRSLGWLSIAGGIGCWLVPVASAALVALTGHDGIANRDDSTFSMGLGQIINGGLYLLASWIMAVGLGVREEAEELQRDAELVV